MSDVIAYAKVDGPPDDWRQCKIFDLDTGAEINRVVEVNAAEGWLVRYKTDAEGNFVLGDDEIVRERITGRFEIRRAA